MGDIANRIALELFFKAKERIKEKKEEKKKDKQKEEEKNPDTKKQNYLLITWGDNSWTIESVMKKNIALIGYA